MALHRLRRDIERQQKPIQDSLERFSAAHHEEGMLQEEFVTIRNDRFVVPVVAGQRRKVYGVIHGASASGHTLFVEPLETIDLNNELVRLREEEQPRSAPHPARDDRAACAAMPTDIRASRGRHGRTGTDLRQGRVRASISIAPSRASAPMRPRLVLSDARHPLLEDVLRRQAQAAWCRLP